MELFPCVTLAKAQLKLAPVRRTILSLGAGGAHSGTPFVRAFGLKHPDNVRVYVCVCERERK